MFKPVVLQNRVEIPIASLQPHVFDVRSTIDNANAIQQLVAQGGPKRLPYVFEDFVVPDGRTAMGALIEMGRDDSGTDPVTIPCTLIKGRYKDMSIEEQDAVRFWALNQNAPNPKEGYRRFATQADIVKTLYEIMLRRDISEAEAVASINAPSAQIRTAFKQATNESNTFMMQQVRMEAEANDITPSQAVRRLRYPSRIAKFIREQATEPKKPGEGIGKMSPKAFIDNRQPALNKARDAVKRYGDAIIDTHKKEPHKMSGKTAIGVIDTHVRTAELILKAAKETQSRVHSTIHQLTPGAHRP